MPFNPIIDRLTQLYRSTGTVLVAIDGPGGAGKSTLADRIASALHAAAVPCTVIQFDDFFLPAARRLHSSSGGAVGDDFDWRRVETEVLNPLRAGRPTRYRRYDWNADALADTVEVPAGGVVVVEGVYSCRSELAARYDLRIWVDCPRDVRLARGLARDGEGARERWERRWMPAEDRYALEQRPRDRADIIVNGFESEERDAADHAP